MTDCVVIGGGPAGSTFAAIAKKLCPSQKIVLLERSRFPRYHVGESTIPVANGVLKELGVYDDLLRSTSVKKAGIVFVWGRDRTPWTADFIQLENGDAAAGTDHVVDVTGMSFRSLLSGIRGSDEQFLGFNVRRSEFDELLLDRARDQGVDVREGTRVTQVLFDGDTVEGVRWRDDAGNTGTIETPFVLDASGLSSLLTRGQRERDPDMNNFAVYGYLSNAQWKVTYNGTRERSTIFIVTIDHGWIWYFPVEDDIMSVGVVTHRDHFKDQLENVDLEQFWWDAISSCPEISGLTRTAVVREDVLPGGKRVAASQDWSSWARTPVGNGWATAGDAAAFVDPILSSGVTMALQSGYRAAYTYNTARLRPDVPTQDLWEAYADYVRGEAASFLKLARYFYGNNRCSESWWWESQQVINASGRLELDARQSFSMATAGFFPTPNSISPAVVGGLLTHLSGTNADLYEVFRNRGVPTVDDIEDCAMRVLVPFALKVRTEPSPLTAVTGRLEVFYDLVSDAPEIAHRSSAVVSRVEPWLAPVIELMPRCRTVTRLLQEASGRMEAEHSSPDTARKAVLGLVQIAALKGFVALDPSPSPPCGT